MENNIVINQKLFCNSEAENFVNHRYKQTLYFKQHMYD